MEQQWDALEMKAMRQLNSCIRNRKAENKMIEYLKSSIFNYIKVTDLNNQL